MLHRGEGAARVVLGNKQDRFFHPDGLEYAEAGMLECHPTAIFERYDP